MTIAKQNHKKEIRDLSQTHFLLVNTLATGALSIALVAPDAWAGAGRSTPQKDAAGVEFFEKNIRPIFAEHCYQCHSDQELPPKGNLRLDGPEWIRKGGNQGPVIEPGYPDLSLLIEAVSYGAVDLRMPPSGKLEDRKIQRLIEWVEMEAPLPEAVPMAEDEAGHSAGIDLEAGREFWAFQPLSEEEPPPVRKTGWARHPIDRFVLAGLEKQGLEPGPPVDRASLLRRVTFDLIGLPPSPAELKDFLADDSPDAFEEVVDRLLASPHYGERWGRHWLDLVRFAETNGHEFDNDKLDAWRYRDYVIRAFNQDVPYDQFVREHIAGDLLPEQRISLDGTHWESPIGTGFLWFGEVLNSPVDSDLSRADQVDNQLDVLSKAFLGLTVACARCHDHKFDPIPTADYYAMAGILHSTNVREKVIDSPQRSARLRSLASRIFEINLEIADQLIPARRRLVERLTDDLSKAASQVWQSRPPPESGRERKDLSHLPWVWTRYLEEACGDPEHVFHPVARLADRGNEWPVRPLEEVRDELAAQLTSLRGESSAALQSQRGDQIFEDFERIDFSGWAVDGEAFAGGPQRRLPPNQPARGHQGSGVANSFGAGTDEWVGSLTSKRFKMAKPWVHVRVGGSKETGADEEAELRVSIVVSDYKAFHFLPTGEGLHWQSELVEEFGVRREAYIEIVDRSRQGHIVVDSIIFSDSPSPPPMAAGPNRHVVDLLQQPVESLPALSASLQELFLGHIGKEAFDRETRWLQEAVSPFPSPEKMAMLLDNKSRNRVRLLQTERRKLADQIPESTFALVGVDWNPRDSRIHVSGSHKNLGEVVPRGFLRVLANDNRVPIQWGSGRRALAEWLTSPQNPLTARVLVNRVWKHYFGQGLVTTPDNFGLMGKRPSHPQLLDYLTTRFLGADWSIKAFHRLILNTSTYRMSSRPRPEASAVDPDNIWLHRMPVKRLEAEAIRDTILAVSGQLDRRLFGPSIVPFITPYHDGRGKPESGPLDGDNRRSIYIEIRRNFLPLFFLAFDYPTPTSTLGRRSVSSVPSQALMLMNNELVTQQAAHWGKRVAAGKLQPRQRIEQMYLTAFSRLPQPKEIDQVMAFLEQQQHHHGIDPASNDFRPWADLGHVLFNSSEFIFIQ